MPRVTDMQVQAAKAMAASVYANDFPEARGGRHIVVSCCFHEDKHPSLSIDTELGWFKCWACGESGGDVITYLKKRTGKGFVEVVESLTGGAQIEPMIRKTTPQPQEEAFNERRAQAIQRVWNESTSIAPGSPVHVYLSTTRRVSLEPMPLDLRYHAGLDYFDQDTGEVVGTYPGLVAAIRNPTGDIVNVHRTFLTTDGKKAPLPSAKRIMASPVKGITKGGAIRLYEAGEVLGVAEGIETAIACQNATGIPVWACVSAGGMEAVVIPQEVKEVIIFADNDASKTGERVSEALQERLRHEGRWVKSVMPNQVGTDWASKREHKETQK